MSAERHIKLMWADLIIAHRLEGARSDVLAVGCDPIIARRLRVACVGAAVCGTEAADGLDMVRMAVCAVTREAASRSSAGRKGAVAAALGGDRETQGKWMTRFTTSEVVVAVAAAARAAAAAARAAAAAGSSGCPDIVGRGKGGGA